MVFVDTPAPPASPDDDPSAFLQSIRELTEKRDREDEERFRKLEEEVKKSREERAARRAERTRSLSPDKLDEPLLPRLHTAPNLTGTPPPLSPVSFASNEMDNLNLLPGPPSPTKDIPEFKGFGSSYAAPASDHGSRPQSASSLARSGTLSWQQRRPGSKAGSRPTSALGSDGFSLPRSVPEESGQPKREQIVASLGSQDPSWFRQTADRGTGSAAYRKSREEVDASHVVEHSRRGLPGLSQEPPVPSSGVSRNWKPEEAPATSTDSDVRKRSTTTSGAAPTRPDLKALVAADASQHEASPLSDLVSVSNAGNSGLGRALTMSSSQARLTDSPNRPNSPTKGIGGFVQSAMMKRTDSVNKRWSTQQPPNLHRHSSYLGGRSGYGGLQGSHSMPKLDPASGSVRLSNLQQSASRGNLPSLAQDETGHSSHRPSLSQHSRSRSVAPLYTSTTDDHTLSPPSPSKRFSPTKSSWVESVLTRPEHKPTASINSQPSWMANIAKAKAERASGETTPRGGTPRAVEVEAVSPTSPNKPKVGFGQDMLKRSESRSLPQKVGTSTPPVTQSPPMKPQSATDSSFKGSPVGSISLSKEREPKSEAVSPFHTTPPKPKSPEPKESSSPTRTVLPKTDVASKPPIDFRSTLRSRPPPEAKTGETPEFLSKFGSLRKTQTEKYVAPDILKGNILRGKAELTKTGGPVKTPRRDELKESLLAKKEDWRKAKEEGRELPEALAKRNMLGHPERPPSSTMDPHQQIAPEALTRFRSLKEKSRAGPDVTAEPLPPRKPEIPAKTEKIAQMPMPTTGEDQTESTRSRDFVRSTDSKPVESKVPREPAEIKDSSPSGSFGPVEVKKPAEATKAETLKQVSKQNSAPSTMENKTNTAPSKLAAFFNPGLANLLARGPPAAARAPSPSPMSGPSTLPQAATDPPMPEPDQPLQDVRKGRAKGPKKRNAGGALAGVSAAESPAPKEDSLEALKPATEEAPAAISTIPSAEVSRPQAPAGSAGAIMTASLKGPAPTIPRKQVPSQASPTLAPKSPNSSSAKPNPYPATFNEQHKATTLGGDDKENADDERPMVKSPPGIRGPRPLPPSATRSRPQSSSSKDDEATTRPASQASSAPGFWSGLGRLVGKTNDSLSTPPPPPRKSSRVVSGQLQQDKERQDSR